MTTLVHLPSRFVVYPAGDGERRVQSAHTVVGLKGVRDGAAFDRLISALRSGIVVAEWVAEQPPAQRAFLVRVVELLAARGVLVDGPARAPDVTVSQAEHLELYGDGTAVAERLSQARVVLVGDGSVVAEAALGLVRAGVGHLKLLGAGRVDAVGLHRLPWLGPDALGHPLHQEAAEALARRYPSSRVSFAFFDADRDPVAHELSRADLLVHVPDGHRPLARRRLNDAALEAGVPLLARRQVGMEVAVGPVVVAQGGPCLRCLDHRLQSNLQRPLEGIALEAALSSHPRGGPPALSLGVGPTPAGLGLLCSEAIAVLAGGRSPDLLGQVALQYVGRADVRRHPVLRIPRCVGCGSAHRRRPRIDAWGSP